MHTNKRIYRLVFFISSKNFAKGNYFFQNERELALSISEGYEEVSFCGSDGSEAEGRPQLGDRVATVAPQDRGYGHYQYNRFKSSLDLFVHIIDVSLLPRTLI
jgi:hypothetical protein